MVDTDELSNQEDPVPCLCSGVHRREVEKGCIRIEKLNLKKCVYGGDPTMRHKEPTHMKHYKDVMDKLGDYSHMEAKPNLGLLFEDENGRVLLPTPPLTPPVEVAEDVGVSRVDTLVNEVTIPPVVASTPPTTTAEDAAPSVGTVEISQDTNEQGQSQIEGGENGDHGNAGEEAFSPSSDFDSIFDSAPPAEMPEDFGTVPNTTDSHEEWLCKEMMEGLSTPNDQEQTQQLDPAGVTNHGSTIEDTVSPPTQAGDIGESPEVSHEEACTATREEGAICSDLHIHTTQLQPTTSDLANINEPTQGCEAGHQAQAGENTFGTLAKATSEVDQSPEVTQGEFPTAMAKGPDDSASMEGLEEHAHRDLSNSLNSQPSQSTAMLSSAVITQQTNNTPCSSPISSHHNNHKMEDALNFNSPISAGGSLPNDNQSRTGFFAATAISEQQMPARNTQQADDRQGEPQTQTHHNDREMEDVPTTLESTAILNQQIPAQNTQQANGRQEVTSVQTQAHNDDRKMEDAPTAPEVESTPPSHNLLIGGVPIPMSAAAPVVTPFRPGFFSSGLTPTNSLTNPPNRGPDLTSSGQPEQDLEMPPAPEEPKTENQGHESTKHQEEDVQMSGDAQEPSAGAVSVQIGSAPIAPNAPISPAVIKKEASSGNPGKTNEAPLAASNMQKNSEGEVKADSSAEELKNLREAESLAQFGAGSGTPGPVFQEPLQPTPTPSPVHTPPALLQAYPDLLINLQHYLSTLVNVTKAIGGIPAEVVEVIKNAASAHELAIQLEKFGDSKSSERVMTRTQYDTIKRFAKLRVPAAKVTKTNYEAASTPMETDAPPQCVEPIRTATEVRASPKPQAAAPPANPGWDTEELPDAGPGGRTIKEPTSQLDWELARKGPPPPGKQEIQAKSAEELALQQQRKAAEWKNQQYYRSPAYRTKLKEILHELMTVFRSKTCTNHLTVPEAMYDRFIDNIDSGRIAGLDKKLRMSLAEVAKGDLIAWKRVVDQTMMPMYHKDLEPEPANEDHADYPDRKHNVHLLFRRICATHISNEEEGSCCLSYEDMMDKARELEAEALRNTYSSGKRPPPRQRYEAMISTLIKEWSKPQPLRDYYKAKVNRLKLDDVSIRKRKVAQGGPPLKKRRNSDAAEE